MFNRYFLTTTVVLTVWIAVTAAADEPSCKNGGIVGDDDHPKCSCPFGFKGFDCSQKVTPCEGRPCRNGGRCTECKNGTFKCACNPQSIGLLCEHRVRPCDSGPCKNGGNCTDDGLKCFKCQCTSGFKGSDCAEIVKPCEIKPCKNDGECTNVGNGRFKCTCQEGFGGTFCDRRDGLYASEILEGRNKDILQLEKWLGGAKAWKLCYRASDDSFAGNAFHARCDNKLPTVTIIRVGKYIFGAFSDIAFGGPTGYKASSASFVFSIVNKDNLPPFKAPVYRYNGNAIYNNPTFGPTFGGGHDIHIANVANLNTNSYSNLGHTYQTPTGYGYASDKVRSLLAGSYKFKPDEVETFYIH